MGDRTKLIGGVLVAALLIGGTTLWRGQARDDAKQQLIEELDRSEVFRTHAELLAPVIEREHEAIYARHTRRIGSPRARTTTFDAEAYRVEMYGHLLRTLREAGHEQDVIALDRFRSRGQ